MKGTLSEMELSVLRQRSLEALRLKAERGELFTCVAVGYLRVGRDAIAIDPDRRIRDAIALVFRRCGEMGSVRAVQQWFLQARLKLPRVPMPYGPGGRRVVWKAPIYSAVHALLSNPIYAGAYAYGRTGRQTRVENGHKRVRCGLALPQEQWKVLLTEHHQGYISWQTYERNQTMIAANRSGPGRGAARNGAALLAGLLRCAVCGRKITVGYGGKGGRVVRYACRAGAANQGTALCISFGGLRVDQAVGEAVVEALQPHGVKAALRAVEDRGKEEQQAMRQEELALEAARYEAELALQRLENVHPRNRLVADDFEHRYNDRLAEVARLEARLKRANDGAPQRVTPEMRAQYLELGRDVKRVWDSENVAAATRKRLVRAVIEEIVVHVEDARIVLRMHWRGGDHTELHVRKNRRGEHRFVTDVETARLIPKLALQIPDANIARLLNLLGKRTGRGHRWTRSRVTTFRAHRAIPVYRREDRRARGELTLEETADRLRVGKHLVRRLIRDRILPARQVCQGAPWAIAEEDLARPAVIRALRGEAEEDERQETFDYGRE